MGRDWKTLSAVVVGAAIAGWLMVRALNGARSREAVAPAIAVATALPAERSDAAATVATDAHAPAASAPADPAANVDTPPADGDESALIDRELAVLAQGLVRDQRIEDRVMPRINDILDVPGVIEYRRAPDFWEPALGGGGARRR